jgi:hypothetical protein
MSQGRPGCWWWPVSVVALCLALVLAVSWVAAAGSEPTVRTIRAAHILVSPNDDPGGAWELETTDPAWSAAQAEATALAAELRAIPDATARATRFAELARATSDDTTSGAQGGDLGAFTREMMVPEFADPLFEAVSPAAGDILGPVRSDFGWHVILYQGEGEPIPPGDDEFFEEEPTPAPTPGLTVEDRGSEPRRVLRYGMPAGGAEIVMSATQTTTVSVDGGDPQSTGLTTTMTWDVTTAPADGTGRVRSDLRLVAVALAHVSGPEMATELARQQFEAMVGLTGWTITDPTGRVVETEVTIPDGLDPTIAQAFRQAVGSFGTLPSAFPEVAVGEGARWRSTIVTPATDLATGSVSDMTSILTTLDGSVIGLATETRTVQDAGSIELPGMPEGTLVFVEGGSGSSTTDLTTDLDGLTMSLTSTSTTTQDLIIANDVEVIQMTMTATSDMTMTSTPKEDR